MIPLRFVCVALMLTNAVLYARFGLWPALAWFVAACAVNAFMPRGET